MSKENKRRDFIRSITLGGVAAVVAPKHIHLDDNDAGETHQAATPHRPGSAAGPKRKFNGVYQGAYLNRVAFPLGGLGAGMFCLEGTGAISHMSVRHKPEIFNEPPVFAALHIKDVPFGTKLLEGPVPEWKFFGLRGTGNGAAGTTWGLPRFKNASCRTAFPYSSIELSDPDLMLKTEIKGWSPFIPADEDNSSLPVAALEYRFRNTGTNKIEAVFSYNAKNFLVPDDDSKNSISPTANGFVLNLEPAVDKPWQESHFAIFTDQQKAVVDHCWFRGGWWDPLTMAWNKVRDGIVEAVEPVAQGAPGASLYVPFSLAAGDSKTIVVRIAWFVPSSNLQIGEIVPKDKSDCDPANGCCSGPADIGISLGSQSRDTHYKPWYSGKFQNIYEVIQYWNEQYQSLDQQSTLFRKAFYASSLPPELLEAVAANLTILKSPTVLRQSDGRLWSWEGCGDEDGCCHGSCSHVWNYAQAIPHLFPTLERTLRNTEFCENQNKEGHQTFRTNLPISPLKHDFHAAADGQLGGIMKMYRDWRISGDSDWMARLFPMVQKSMDYCIQTWDPNHKGILEEPHHNTYDIEFWGPDGMCCSFYLGALTAIIGMGRFLKKDMSFYEELYRKGKNHLETDLFNDEYFFQDIEYKNLRAPDPAKAQSFGGDYSDEAKTILKKEGPKYQYGTGCLSDGVLGAWIGSMCGLDHFIDDKKIRSHLNAVYQHNLMKNLREHANPQRPAYALGEEGGLLLCSWPRGGKLSLPFVYSDEVWTGIEYQVASHLMLMGEWQKGLDIVRTCRDRYDGRRRNPFNEYECGHWYARAMSSYGLLQGLTGLRYDAVDKTLFIDSQVGDFTSFLSTATGFGTVSFKSGKASVQVSKGSIDVDRIIIKNKKTASV